MHSQQRHQLLPAEQKCIPVKHISVKLAKFRW